MIAQSTFFMQQDHGRARVFQQWGDDDETIQIAIKTCPVDCIHYVSYDELVQLEIDRRTQNINPKVRFLLRLLHFVTKQPNTTRMEILSHNSILSYPIHYYPLLYCNIFMPFGPTILGTIGESSRIQWSWF